MDTCVSPKTIQYIYGDRTCFELCPLCNPQGNITVEFLDYGGRELVSLASVKALPGNFLELPFQGIHCSLKGETPLRLSHSFLLWPLGIVWEQHYKYVLWEYSENQLHKLFPLRIIPRMSPEENGSGNETHPPLILRSIAFFFLRELSRHFYTLQKHIGTDG